MIAPRMRDKRSLPGPHRRSAAPVACTSYDSGEQDEVRQVPDVQEAEAALVSHLIGRLLPSL